MELQNGQTISKYEASQSKLQQGGLNSQRMASQLQSAGMKSAIKSFGQKS